MGCLSGDLGVETEDRGLDTAVGGGSLGVETGVESSAGADCETNPNCIKVLVEPVPGLEERLGFFNGEPDLFTPAGLEGLDRVEGAGAANGAGAGLLSCWAY